MMFSMLLKHCFDTFVTMRTIESHTLGQFLSKQMIKSNLTYRLIRRLNNILTSVTSKNIAIVPLIKFSPVDFLFTIFCLFYCLPSYLLTKLKIPYKLFISLIE